MSEDVLVRPARTEDLARVAALAGELVRMHHATDPARFFLPDNVEDGYAWWLERELRRKEAVVLVAELGQTIAGYAYGALAERDFNLLLDKHAAIHDVFVDESARRHGTGKLLVTAMQKALTELGAPRIVLSTMVGNQAAQKLFATCGFRPTMLEMTCG